MTVLIFIIHYLAALKEHAVETTLCVLRGPLVGKLHEADAPHLPRVVVLRSNEHL